MGCDVSITIMFKSHECNSLKILKEIGDTVLLYKLAL